MVDDQVDLGDEKQVKKVRRQRKSKEYIAKEELKALLEMPAFRRFVWTQLTECGTHRISHRGEETHDAAFNEGMRNCGNLLIARIDAATPHSYIKIYGENRKD